MLIVHADTASRTLLARDFLHALPHTRMCMLAIYAIELPANPPASHLTRVSPVALLLGPSCVSSALLFTMSFLTTNTRRLRVSRVDAILFSLVFTLSVMAITYSIQYSAASLVALTTATSTRTLTRARMRCATLIDAAR